jgi:hypothetical protein
MGTISHKTGLESRRKNVLSAATQWGFLRDRMEYFDKQIDTIKLTYFSAGLYRNLIIENDSLISSIG